MQGNLKITNVSKESQSKVNKTLLTQKLDGRSSNSRNHAVSKRLPHNNSLPNIRSQHEEEESAFDYYGSRHHFN